MSKAQSTQHLKDGVGRKVRVSLYLCVYEGDSYLSSSIFARLRLPLPDSELHGPLPAPFCTPQSLHTSAQVLPCPLSSFPPLLGSS